jgi:hypothetical protein
VPSKCVAAAIVVSWRSDSPRVFEEGATKGKGAEHEDGGVGTVPASDEISSGSSFEIVSTELLDMTRDYLLASI